MTFEIAIVLIIIAIAVFLFIWEKFSVDSVAIMVMITLALAGILTPKEALNGFANSATLTVGAMFVLSAAIFKTGILNGLGDFLVDLARRNYIYCLLALMFISAVLSAFINDTAVVALLMPVTLQIARTTEIPPSKLLIPLSFGALLGGVGTLIGTSTNILVSGLLEERGLEPIGMFEMTGPGVLFMLAGIVYIIAIGHRLLPNREATPNIQEAFEMKDYLAEIKLTPQSKSVGCVVGESPLVKVLEVEVLQIIREDGRVVFPMPYTVLQSGDQLKVRCDIPKVKELAKREGILVKGDLGELEDNEVFLYEFMVGPGSNFIGKSLAEIRFKEIFRGASVLAIRNRFGIVHEKIGRTTLKSGDNLLVRSDKVMLSELTATKDLIFLSEKSHKGLPLPWTIFTLAVTATAVIIASLQIFPIVITAIAAIVILIFAGILKPDEAYKAIEWRVIFMLAGILSMGVALEKSGAAALMSNQIIYYFEDTGPYVLLAIFFGFTFMLTNVLSNNATAVLLIPIAILTAENMGISARPFIMAITFSASLSFMTPVGYQTNNMVYVAGNYKFVDFLKVGTPLNLILWMLGTLIIPWFFPF
jgi:di/tricarboxylate transporter